MKETLLIIHVFNYIYIYFHLYIIIFFHKIYVYICHQKIYIYKYKINYMLNHTVLVSIVARLRSASLKGSAAYSGQEVSFVGWRKNQIRCYQGALD